MKRLGVIYVLFLAKIMLGSYDIIRLAPERWQEYRELRLRALKEEPVTFASCYDEERCFPEKYWRNKLPLMFFAEHEGKLIGMAGLLYECEEFAYCRHLITISNVYVIPEARSKGVGFKLIDALLAHLEQRKEPIVAMLWVVTHKESVVKFYEKCGFEKTGILKDNTLFEGNWFDSYLMQKTINKNLAVH